MEEKINFTERFRNSRLFKKPPKPKSFLVAIWQKLFKPAILWDWTDIALCFRVYKQTDIADYHIAIDIQILWLNIWTQCFRKNK